MRNLFRSKYITAGRFLWLPVLLALFISRPTGAATLDSHYPGLSTGLLKSAELAPLNENTLLSSKGVTITRAQLLEGIKDQDPGLRAQLEKNLFFVLEQEAVRQFLLGEAEKAGISVKDGDDNRAIQALFENRTRDIAVSEEEARAFYAGNKEMVGGAPFEQVADGIRQYLLQDKKQQAVSVFIAQLGDTSNMRVNAAWMEEQSRLAMDNPVDKARRSGKPTMVEFGSKGCVPCDMMQPILDKLRKDYPEQLNVVFVQVGEEQLLAARFGIRSIPVQVFYDASGKEVFRHEGFFAQTEVEKQIVAMGVRK